MTPGAGGRHASKRRLGCGRNGAPAAAGLTHHEEWVVLGEQGFHREADPWHGEHSQSVLILTVPHLDCFLCVHSEREMQPREGRQELDARWLHGAGPDDGALGNKSNTICVQGALPTQGALVLPVLIWKPLPTQIHFFFLGIE